MVPLFDRVTELDSVELDLSLQNEYMSRQQKIKSDIVLYYPKIGKVHLESWNTWQMVHTTNEYIWVFKQS